jgi:hypothetical protein
LNQFFLVLEKLIVDRGNLFVLHVKKNYFYILEFSPQRCYPGNLGKDSLLGRATKILGEFPARKVFLARKSLVVTSWLGVRKVNGTFFTV